jgi:hypothetical protein
MLREVVFLRLQVHSLLVKSALLWYDNNEWGDEKTTRNDSGKTPFFPVCSCVSLWDVGKMEDRS